MKTWLIARRNLALFLNNKMNLLLSFASIAVVLSLYVLFLREFLVDLMGEAGIQAGLVEQFTDKLMLSGLLVVVNTTTCFGMIQICVSDAANGIRRDYLAAPIRPYTLISGYWLASGLVSCFFTCITLLGIQLFFQLQYAAPLPGKHLLEMLGMIACGSILNSALLLCFAKGLKSTTTFSTFANLYGTLIGFLSGCYLPYYFYPDWLQPMLFFFPPTQLVSVLRQLALADLKPTLFPGQPNAVSDKLFQNMGVFLQQGSRPVSLSVQLWLLAAALLLLTLALCSLPGRVQKHNIKK